MKKDDEKEEEEKALPVRVMRRRHLMPREFFSDFDRMMEDFRTDMESFFWSAPWRPSRGLVKFSTEPPVDIVDAGKEIIVNADLPGIPKESIEIHIGENSIEISGEGREEKEEEREGYYYRERGYHKIRRELPLPSEVVADKAEATMKNGVLEVRIPKKVPTPEPKRHKLKPK